LRLVRERRGQFIVIAALLISIMIVSVSTVIYGTVTYFKYERWEEYLTIVDSVRTATNNLLQIRLANYSQIGSPPNPPPTLRDNLNQWIGDVRKAYPGFGVDLSYSLASGVKSAFGMTLNYNLGLARRWYQSTSFSAANATFNLNIASVGLTGYNFTADSFLKVTIRDAVWYGGSNSVSIYLTVDREGPEPVLSLLKSNFVVVKASNVTQSNFTLRRYYSSTFNSFIYEVQINSISALPSSVELTIHDGRGMRVISASIPRSS